MNTKVYDAANLGGFFASIAWNCSFLGRSMRGTVRLDGVFCRSVNPHGSALFAFDSAWAGNIPTTVGAML